MILIHYTGQYLVNKKVYKAFLKAKNKESYRHEHAVEIAKFESARSWLNSHVKNDSLPSRGIINTAPGTIPNIKELKDVRSRFIDEQKRIRSEYYAAKSAHKEINTVVHDIDILINPPTKTKHKIRNMNNAIE